MEVLGKAELFKNILKLSHTVDMVWPTRPVCGEGVVSVNAFKGFGYVHAASVLVAVYHYRQLIKQPSNVHPRFLRPWLIP